MTIKKYDIKERLIDFSVNIITFIEKLPNIKSTYHLGNQLLRFGISPALNYGEAKSAESKNDFMHKLKICLKELRETYVCLKIMEKVKDFKNEDPIKQLINESNELISIFVKSVETAQMKQVKY